MKNRDILGPEYGPGHYQGGLENTSSFSKKIKGGFISETNDGFLTGLLNSSSPGPGEYISRLTFHNDKMKG